MYFLECKISEDVRLALLYVACIFQMMGFVISLAVLSFGVDLFRQYVEYTKLIIDFDANLLPNMLIGVGIGGAFAHFVGFFVCSASTYPKQRTTANYFLVGCLVLSICLAVCSLVVGILTLTGSSAAQEGFKVINKKLKKSFNRIYTII